MLSVLEIKMIKRLLISYTVSIALLGFSQISNAAVGKASASEVPIEKNINTKERFQYVQDSSYACIPSIEKLTPQVLDLFAFDGRSRGLIDLIIPIELTNKIINDLQSKASSKKVAPEEFWLILDYELAKELNELLLKSFILIDKFAFKKLRDIVAFGITFLTEQYIATDHAMTIIFNEFGKNRRFTMAFNSMPQLTYDLLICNETRIKRLSYAPSNLLSSDQIDGIIECIGEEHTIILRKVFKRKLQIKLLKNNFFREVFTRDLEIKHYKKHTKIFYQDKEVTINLKLLKKRFEKLYLEGSAQSISFSIRDEFGYFSESDISCRTIKHLQL